VTGASADGTVRTTGHPAPWDRRYASGRDRKAALIEYATTAPGFTPLDVIDLAVPGRGPAALITYLHGHPASSGR
jgi:hypothetical protein